MLYNGASGVLIGSGVKITIDNVVDNCEMALTNMPYPPKISTNLIYINKLYSHNNVSIEFFTYCFYVNDLTYKRMKLERASKKGLYALEESIVTDCQDQASLLVDDQARGFLVSLKIWHHRLGHPSLPLVKSIIKKHGIKVDSSGNTIL